MATDTETALLDILELIARIDRQALPLGRDAFIADSDALDATAYRLLAIGEAAKAVPDTVRARHSGIPWTQITGLRNILAHQYFGREYAIIWETIVTGLPPLAAVCRSELDHSATTAPDDGTDMSGGPRSVAPGRKVD